MAAWYKTGTVTVTQLFYDVVGVDTLWSTQVSVGDIFTVDNTNLYEIESITDDTHLVLATAFAETSVIAGTYSIIRNFAATTSAILAAALAEMLNRWHNREDEWYAWHNGTVTGGTNNDGQYPFTDLAGNVTLINCPAKMVALALAAGSTSVVDTSGTIALNFAQSSGFYVTLTGTGRTVTFANPVSGQVYRLLLIQGSGGSKTITTWPTITWLNGATAPVLSSTAAKADAVTLWYVNGVYYGSFTSA